MALCALAGMTFLTGCGDDDGGNNSAEDVLAEPPPDFRAYGYTLTYAGDPNAQVLTFPQQNRYQITTAEYILTGSYSNPRFTGNQMSVTLTPDDPQNDAGVLTMIFAREGQGGTFVFTPAGGGAEQQGVFTFAALSEINDPPVPPAPENDHALPNIIGSWNLDVQTGPFAGRFIATYDPSNFTIVRASDSHPMGNGSYTFTRSTENSNQATLVHNYSGAFNGDQDNYLLDFFSPFGATFTGTVISPAGSPPQAVSGTFTK